MAPPRLVRLDANVTFVTLNDWKTEQIWAPEAWEVDQNRKSSSDHRVVVGGALTPDPYAARFGEVCVRTARSTSLRLAAESVDLLS